MDNSNANTRIVKNSVYLYIRLAISLVIGLITSRLVLSALGVEDYGLYNLVGGFVLLLGILSSSMTSASQRFITYSLGEKDIVKQKATYSTITTLMMVLALAILVIGAVLGIYVVQHYLNIPQDKRTIAIGVYLCSLIVFSINIMAIPDIAAVMAHEHMGFYAFMSVGDSVAKLGIAYLLFAISADRVLYYAIMLAVISIVVRLSYGIYTRKQFEESNFSLRVDKTIIKQVFSFSAWMTLGCGAGVLKDQGGNILLNLFFGLAFNASNGVANQVKNIFTAFASNIGTAIAPQITKSYAAGDVVRSISLTLTMAKFQSFCMILVLLPILLECPFLLKLWLTEIPVSSVLFVRLMVVICFVTCLTQTYGPLFLAVGKIKKLQTIISITSLLNIPICYLIYASGGPPETYLCVTLVLESIIFFICYGYMKLTINFPLGKLLKDVILKSFIIITTGGFVGYCIHMVLPEEEWLSFIVDVIFLTIMSLLIMYLYGLNKREKEYLLNFLNKK